MFGLRLTTAIDKNRFIAAEALAKNGRPEDVAFLEKMQKDPEPAFRTLRSFGSYQSEIMIIRLVDNFFSFLSEILQACMLKRPELLRSSEQIRTEDILRFTKRDELLDFLINRKLNELSYGGLRGIEDFLDQRLGLALARTKEERGILSIAVELRNIYTHNRGVVNQLFLSRISNATHNFNFIEGQRFHANFDAVVLIANCIFDIAKLLDVHVTKKYKLQARKFKTWDAPRKGPADSDAL